MKKIVTILLGVLLCSGILKAQGIDLGVKGGYLYSAMDTKDLKDIKTKAKGGYLLGVFARFSAKAFFFQPEIQYRARTADFNVMDVLTNNAVSKISPDLADKMGGNIEVNYKTFDIPLQVGVDVLDLSLATISIHGGAVASFKLSDDNNKEDMKAFVQKYIEDNFTDYNAFVWYSKVGVSVDFARFVFELSYEKGLSDIAKRGIGKNDLFMATLGINFF